MQQQMLESQARRRWQVVRKQSDSKKTGGHVTRNRRCRRVLMKSRAGVRGYRSNTATGIHKRVKTLKKLIPNSESMGLEGLFRETADYILSLQMRVNLMQIMVKVLSSDSDQ
ncbi:transcription factor, putative [Ricinus communis]|uniref:Transcription factor, putative n=2 Tax=Ricinus communis TaxID=3988 RepID=B9RNB4_RICCO|nr:transcription factor, putative [Ricinus communis]